MLVLPTTFANTERNCSMNKPNDAPKEIWLKEQTAKLFINQTSQFKSDVPRIRYVRADIAEKALLAEAEKSDKAIKLLKLKHAKQRQADEQLIGDLRDVLINTGDREFWFDYEHELIASAKKRLKKGEDDG